MPITDRRWLIEKHFDPTNVPHYAEALAPLPGYEEEDISVEGGRVIVAADLGGDDQVEEIGRRDHVVAIHPNYTANFPEPIVEGAAARDAEAVASSIAALVGADRVHAHGVRGAGRRIAVIDTGCGQDTLREIGSRVKATESFIPSENAVNEGDTHGDWCVQIVAALCPDSEFVVLKGLSGADGRGTYSGIIACVKRAVELGCTEISMSLGGPASPIMDDAVNAADAAGRIVAVAAGNEQRGRTDYVADVTSPARAPGALTVGAARADRVIADFSNWGACLDLSAPGYQVEAPNVPGLWSGTSMATPVVAAGCALVASAGGRDKAAVRQAVVSTALNTEEPPHEEGHGFLAVAAAVGVPAPFHPGVKRTSLYRYARGGYAERCVVTRRGHEVAYSVPKG